MRQILNWSNESQKEAQIRLRCINKSHLFHNLTSIKPMTLYYFRIFFHSCLCKWELHSPFYILPKEKYKLVEGEFESKSASTEFCFFGRKKKIHSCFLIQSHFKFSCNIGHAIREKYSIMV